MSVEKLKMHYMDLGLINQLIKNVEEVFQPVSHSIDPDKNTLVWK